MKLSQKEIKYGILYMAISLLVLPGILGLLPLRAGQVNFAYFCINFGAVAVIFRRFLLGELAIALDRPFPTIYYAILGYLGYEALTQLVTAVILILYPDFANINDQSLNIMFRQDLKIMTIGVMLLVPLAEECLFRGLIFQGMYPARPKLAHIVSMVAFALVHVAGYVGTCNPLQLLLCFVQYLPAGYCLCFAYRRSGTLMTPVLVHTIVNALGVYNAVR